MSPEQRRAEFVRIFEAMPGKRIDRIRRVGEILSCKTNTVRIYLLKTPGARTIPESKLKLLRVATKNPRVV